MEKQILEINSDVKETKALVLELVKQGAVHNEILLQHERRSTNLEERFKPVEENFIFLTKISGAIAILGGVSGAIFSILRVVELLSGNKIN